MSGYWNVGGLVGWTEVDINNCYASGNVSGYREVGGLAGYLHANNSNCYATGNVNGTEGLDSVTNSGDWDGTLFNYETGTYQKNSGSTGLFTLQVGVNGITLPTTPTTLYSR